MVGNVNTDLVTSVPRFPRMGETLLGADFNRFIGGKGANQAMAIARLGANICIVGTVGDDGLGYEMLTNLDREGVCSDCVKTVQGYPSGIVSITIAGGENSIVIVSGADFALTPKGMLTYEEIITGNDVVLSQLETPMEYMITAAKLTQKHDRPSVLNPASVQKLPQELFELTTLLTPDTYELTASLGLPQDMSAEGLINRSPCPVLMTVGEKDAIYNDERGVLYYVPSFPVTPVSSTGTGDIFNGVFTTYWKGGMETVVRKVYTAAAVPITQNDAQNGISSEEKPEEFLTIR